ncbi:DNA polymerase zeta [Linderina pennispora]|nr:DNA polymerase zeta [Linderina pennispora]
MSVTPTKSSTSQQLNCIGKREKVPMSQMSLEIITSTRDWLLPDPKLDSVLCMVACMVTDKPQWDLSPYSGCRTVVWTHGTSRPLSRLGFPGHVEHLNLDDEVQMITEFTQWVCTHDPDILCGYEVQNSSWGYLIERADVVYGMRLCSDLSRIIDPPWRRQQSGYGREQDSWSYKKGAALSIAGRHVLNVWRLMRSELALTSYSFEKIAEEVLKEKVPHFTHSRISQWFLNGPAVAGIRAIRHVMYRARADLRLLDTMDVVQRASEFASIIGIDFDSVITRGSQLRVESLMARIAHPELYILSSPTREQVTQQRAAECVPLVLEPQSRYYTDPVVVLDFQSLYPSIMIAYNYCFSTCLGSVEDAASQAPGTKRRLGFTDVHIPPGILSKLRDHVTVSPNGAVFVKPEIRKGLLGRMLQEILESRVMLKNAIKTWGDDETLCKNLDARQLGLKLIANVTYGYTGASFSGRMPCVEIADAIVQSGRETLESAIRFIHSKHDEWGARVVYGDTDSVFVHFPGKSRQTAFKLGHEIAQAVTALNPAPVKLKFEKVYQPCVLLTKKRYAGWMYTAPDQADPMLDVKGMELVRRDGCVAAQKIIEGTMDRLFATNDLSQVKSFITDEISKVSQGEYPMMDFFIAKEVRLGTYSAQVLPPHAKVSMDDMQSDARAEPQYGERVPYVVVDGGPNARLTDQVVRPLALLNRPELHLNYQYYISKQIVPALDRVLGLVGIDVRTWVNDMPRHRRKGLHDSLVDVFLATKPDDDNDGLDKPVRRRPARRTLDHFYHERSCLLCRQTMPHLPSPGRAKGASDKLLRVCEACLDDRPALMSRLARIQMGIDWASKAVLDKCVQCVGGGNRADVLMAVEGCDSLDCPTMFERHKLARRNQAWARLRTEMESQGI